VISETLTLSVDDDRRIWLTISVLVGIEISTLLSELPAQGTSIPSATAADRLGLLAKRGSRLRGLRTYYIPVFFAAEDPEQVSPKMKMDGFGQNSVPTDVREHAIPLSL
jgi:hypothetical protein